MANPQFNANDDIVFTVTIEDAITLDPVDPDNGNLSFTLQPPSGPPVTYTWQWDSPTLIVRVRKGLYKFPYSVSGTGTGSAQWKSTQPGFRISSNITQFDAV